MKAFFFPLGSAALFIAGCEAPPSAALPRPPPVLVINVSPVDAHVQVIDRLAPGVDGKFGKVLFEGDTVDRQIRFQLESYRTIPGEVVAIAPGFSGWKSLFRPEEPVDVILTETDDAREARISEEKKKRLKDFIAAHSELTPRYIEALEKGQILAGMTREAVELAWGEPKSKNVRGGLGGNTEVWFYEREKYKLDALYFMEGRLVRWSLDR